MSEDVRREASPDRFEITVDGTVAGLARFVDDEGRRIFFHTEVDDAFEGRGLARTLVRQALDATRAEGLRVVPVCSYVEHVVERDADYRDLADPVTDDALAAARRAASSA